MSLETTIQGFTLVRRIGEGSFGIVYEAINLSNKRRRAIKIEKEPGKDGKAGQAYILFGRKQLFTNEGLVDLFNHPYSVRYYTEGLTEEGRRYIEFELLEGTPLSQYSCTPVEAKRFLTQLVDVVSHMHHKGILHNDIRPDNIMVVDDDRTAEKKKMIKLIDSGIALPHEQGKAVQQANISSREISAPESILQGALTIQTDIWAIGVTAYKMCTGEHPFPHEDKNDLAKYIADPRAFVDLARRIKQQRSIPKELKPIITRCLAYDPAQRYQTGAEIAHALAPERTFRQNLTRTLAVVTAGVFLGAVSIAAYRDSLASAYNDLKTAYYLHSPWDRKIYRSARVPKDREKYLLCEQPAAFGLSPDRFLGKERYCQEFQDAQQLLDHAKYAQAGYLLENLRKRQPTEVGPAAALVEVYLEIGFYQEAQQAFRNCERAFPSSCSSALEPYLALLEERKGWVTNPIDFVDPTVCELELVKRQYPECIALVAAAKKSGNEQLEAYRRILREYPSSSVARFVVQEAAP